MEQKLIQAVLGILVGLMVWNFKTLNDMQLSMETIMYKYANLEDINELRLKIRELEWKLMRDSMEK